MYRRIEPKQGHALFFPTKEYNQVIIGRPIFLWLWSWLRQEFKHIQLGDFRVTVQFGPSSVNPSAKTADDLPCQVQSIFRLKVNEDVESLTKSTRTCSTSRDINVIISHDFFKRETQSRLEALTEIKVREVTYSDLFTKPERVKELENVISTEAAIGMGDLGFTLLGCRVDIEPQAPTAEVLAQNTKIREIWNSHLEIKGKIELETLKRKNELEEVKKQEENRSKLARDKDDMQYDINRQIALNNRDEELRKLKIADEESRQKSEEERAEISRALQKLNDDMQREKLTYEHERVKLEASQEVDQTKYEEESSYEMKKEELKRQFNLNKLKREEEEKEWQQARDSLQHKLQLEELRAQQADLQQKIAEAERIQIETIGKAKAEVERLNDLAIHAYAIEINQALLNALPSILEKAYVPSEKLGEIKVMYLAGQGPNGGDATQAPIGQALGSILSSMSTLPMLREVLHFLNNWDLPLTGVVDQARKWPDSNKQSAQQMEVEENT